ncbi:MAG: BrnA antitoxin family protein [Burkholderiaceae bacterium]|nr:BrnA antitoxin family protein [Burkholderiaceae bacterium]
MPHKPHPERLDDESPELTAEWFAKAKPASEVLPKMIGTKSAEELLRPRRGRPPLPATKEHVNIRLDADVVQAFKSKGPGWQTRLNAALREWLRSQPM